jgi:hypothetical protein
MYCGFRSLSTNTRLTLMIGAAQKEKEELNDLNGELEELELLGDDDQTVP